MRADGVIDDDLGWEALYIQDAYWVSMTMTTVGYGDIHPLGSSSRIYAVVAMALGTVSFGATVSALGHFTRGIFQDGVELQIADLSCFMTNRGVSTELQTRVQQNLRYQLRNQKMRMMDPALVSLLSLSTQRELSVALLGATIGRFPFFQGEQHSFLAELAQAHTCLNCLPGDLVVEAGQFIEELVFIVYGLLEVQLSSNGFSDDVPDEHELDEVEKKVLKSGAWFGQECLFTRGLVRTETILATSVTELAVLLSTDYLAVVRKFPRMREKHARYKAALSTGTMSIAEFSSERQQDHSPKPARRISVKHLGSLALPGAQRVAPESNGVATFLQIQG
jgi:hyperpolarization activated cyclic nucleotide-gated potassium channel 2